MSKRDDVMAAAVTAISVASVTRNAETTTKPTGLTVHRHLMRQANASSLPDVTAFMAGEVLDDAITDEADRALSLRFRCRVAIADDESGDEALDPILTWVELSLTADYTLGGTCAALRVTSIDAISALEYADGWAEATVQVEVTYMTKWGDPRQAP